MGTITTSFIFNFLNSAEKPDERIPAGRANIQIPNMEIKVERNFLREVIGKTAP